jgi:alanine dehydrogenase
MWIGDDEAQRLLSLEDSIDVLAEVYRQQGRGLAVSMPRAHVRHGEAILHAVGGLITTENVTGTKTWTYTPNGAAPLLVLFSLADGDPIAVIEAFSMGRLRTAATSALGTRVLARADARTLALLGTGRQAFEQARAVAAVRPIDHVRLFGRDPDRRAALATRLRTALDLEVTEHADVEGALAGADVVTTITRAAAPIVSGPMLEPGVHVNAVGAIVPSRRELDESAVERCALVVADSVAQARKDAGELLAAASADRLDWDSVHELAAVLDEGVSPARAPGDVTLFKALGVGLADVALGTEILRRARAVGAGRPLPTPALTNATPGRDSS